MPRAIRALLVVMSAQMVALLPMSAAGADDLSKVTIHAAEYFPAAFPAVPGTSILVASGGAFGNGKDGTGAITQMGPTTMCGPHLSAFCMHGQDVYTFAKGTITLPWRGQTRITSPTTSITTGTWRITSGTGAYAGAHGSGTWRDPCTFDASGNGLCIDTLTGRMQVDE
jgi:hypothetical protein